MPLFEEDSRIADIVHQKYLDADKLDIKLWMKIRETKKKIKVVLIKDVDKFKTMQMIKIQMTFQMIVDFF